MQTSPARCAKIKLIQKLALRGRRPLAGDIKGTRPPDTHELSACAPSSRGATCMPPHAASSCFRKRITCHHDCNQMILVLGRGSGVRCSPLVKIDVWLSRDVPRFLIGEEGAASLMRVGFIVQRCQFEAGREQRNRLAFARMSIRQAFHYAQCPRCFLQINRVCLALE